ncbi:MAG TPA: ATP-binding protein [Anaerolineales bacterium]|nr:ATP-binding protein [Anaerolineales bacterium]
MTEKIEETLRRLSGAISRATQPTSSTSDPPDDVLGDPDCPFCHGAGYLRDDHPVGHPDFGRLTICTCRLAQVRSHIRDRLFSLSHLEALQHLSFESFNPHGRVGLGEREQNSIENAYQRAMHFSQSLEGWLLILGGYGCGKTHLAAAIANACVALGVPTLFLTVPDLLDWLRYAYSDKEADFETRFEQVRRAPLLILDDLGTQNATDWAREKLFQIINHRYVNKLPTVLTTNLALDEIDGRIRSRLSDPEMVGRLHIQAPDYRRPLDDAGHHELSSLADHAHQTFGTYSLRKGEKLPAEQQRSLEEAFKITQVFAEDPRGWLFIGGRYGCGKTHLAAAIANYRATQGYPAMFVIVPDLLDHLRATFNPNSTVSYDRRFEEVRNAELLILDDLGTQAMTPWVREKLYQLFNHRYNASLPTVITSADPAEEIDPRLRTRMEDRRLCTRILISAPSFRGGKPRGARAK